MSLLYHRLLLRRLLLLRDSQLVKRLYCSANPSSSSNTHHGAGLPKLRLSPDSIVRQRFGFLRMLRGRLFLAMLRSMSADPDLAPRPLIEACRELLPNIVSAIDADCKGTMAGSAPLDELLGPECLPVVREHYRGMSEEQRETLARMAKSTFMANIEEVDGVMRIPGGVPPPSSSARAAPPRILCADVSLRLNLMGCLTQLDSQNMLLHVVQMMSQKPTLPALLSDGFVWSLALRRTFILPVMRQGVVESLTLPDGSQIVDNGWIVGRLNVMYLRDAIEEQRR